MKVSFQWKVNNQKYLYIVDKGATEGGYGRPFLFNVTASTCTYLNGPVLTGMTRALIMEEKIKTLAAALTESEYKTLFNEMVALSLTDVDAKKLRFMDYSFYYNIEADKCAEEAIIPTCEEDHDNIDIEANVSMKIGVVNSSNISIADDDVCIDGSGGNLLIDSKNIKAADTSITVSFAGVTSNNVKMVKSGNGMQTNVNGGAFKVNTATTTVNKGTVTANNSTVHLNYTPLHFDLVDDGDGRYAKGDIISPYIDIRYGATEYHDLISQLWMGYDKDNELYSAKFNQSMEDSLLGARHNAYLKTSPIIANKVDSGFLMETQTDNGLAYMNTTLKTVRRNKNESDSTYCISAKTPKKNLHEILKVYYYVYDDGTTTREKSAVNINTTTLDIVSDQDINITSSANIKLTGKNVDVNGMDLTKLSNAINTVTTSSTIALSITRNAGTSTNTLTAKLVNSSITSTHLNNNCVTANKILNSAVTTNKIDKAAVTTTKIADSAVTTIKIADKAVTHAKIADDAVETNNIKDNAVTSNKLQSGSVVTDKIANSAVTTNKIADKAVTINKIDEDLTNIIPAIGTIMIWNGRISHVSEGIAVRDFPHGWMALPVNGVSALTVKYTNGADINTYSIQGSFITIRGLSYSANELTTWLRAYGPSQIKYFTYNNYNSWPTSGSGTFTIDLPNVGNPPNAWSGGIVNGGCYIMRYK